VSGARAHAPRSTRLGRLLDYLGEMFPLHVMLPGTVICLATNWITLSALDHHAARITWRVAVAAVSNMFFMLLLRVYDELKDVDTDLRLGRAGDPRYVHRAVVTGHVQVGDIVALRNGALVALVALNTAAFAGSRAFLVFAAVTFVFWTSSRWYFWPTISKHLLLAFVTHNPLSIGIGLYWLAVYAQLSGAGALPPHWLAFLGVTWMQAAAWELSRKVRRPEDETDYQTYSKVLGWRVAGVLPAITVGFATVAWLIIAHATSAPAWLSWTLVGACAVVLLSCLRFELAPSTKSANLRAPVELFGAVASITVPLALGLKYSLTFA
jgi:4-hydroxybenzoate polyprenyltransferase